MQNHDLPCKHLQYIETWYRALWEASWNETRPQLLSICIHQYIDDDDIGARPARITPVSWSTNVFSVSTRSVRGFALLLLPSAEGLLGVVGVGGALKPGGN